MKQYCATVIILCLCYSLSGCASPSINANDPQEVSRHIKVQQDEYMKSTSYTGPNCADDQTNHIVLIRAWKTRDEIVTYQIYLSDMYTYARLQGGTGWKFYSLAHDIDGNSLPTATISRHVNWCGRYTCQYQEIVGVTITRKYLEDRSDRGLSIKISGTGGQGIATVPAAYVQAFIDNVPDRKPTRAILPTEQ